mgnify:CR=1 FL=1
MRAPRRHDRSRHDRPDGEHERSLHVAVQAAVRSRRHGARAASKLSAVRAPHAAGRRLRGAASTSNTTADGKSTSPRCDAAPARTRAIVIVSPNNPTGSYRDGARARPCSSRSAASARWALIADEVFADYPLDVDAPVTDIAARAGCAVVHARRLVEVRGTAAVEARMDCGRWTGQRRVPPRSPDSELIADSFLSVEHAGAGCGGRICSNAAPRSAQQIHERVAREPARRFATSRASFDGMRRVEGRRRMVGGRSRAGDAQRGTARPRPARSRRASSCIPDISSTFSARRFVVVSLLPPPRRLSDDGVRPELLRVRELRDRQLATLASHAPRPGITPRRGADPAVFDSLVSELGHRRDRRHRSDRPAGSTPRASESCSCFRSTKCRPARRRPIRR